MIGAPLVLPLLALLLQPAQSLPSLGAAKDVVVGKSLHYKLVNDCPAHMSLKVQIQADGETPGAVVEVNLMESSADFLHSSERSGAGGGILGSYGEQIQPAPHPPCFYQGKVAVDNGLAVANQRNGWFSGTIHFAGRVYEIPEQHLPHPIPPNSAPLIARKHVAQFKTRTCGVRTQVQDINEVKRTQSAESREHDLHHRSRRSPLLDTNSNFSEINRKYIQLILVGDQSFYANQSNNMTQAQDRLWVVGNYVNALYKQLGANVITVYTETWTKDPYNISNATSPSGVSSTEMLDLFMKYRMQKLNVKPHSAAHLISALKFAGSGDVGLAHMGKLCSFERGGGVNSDREVNPYGIAATVAHELGHNLGFNHDEDEKAIGCYCPDSQGCVMATVGNEVNPVRFANCSLFRFLDFSVPNGLGYCMSNPPTDAVLVGAKATCGNKIVEAGEDCDCGPMQWCNNTCCNPFTCKFTSGAACASGECCNTQTCTIKSQGTVCRAARDTCDLPEYCNGSSEWCPQFDDYRLDGVECLAGKAYCYKGRCNDRDTRCTAIFNGTGISAAPAAWSVGTTLGNEHGYCSYNETTITPLAYSYTACSVANQRCGVLYCQGPTALVTRWKGMDGSELRNSIITVSGASQSAFFAQYNLKYSGYRDPGLVPNGAECGTNMMCVDTVCVSTTSSVTCPNCNSRGVCAQSGLCFCDTGFRPPDCQIAGGGGSLTNRLPDNTTTTTTTTTTTVSTTTGTTVQSVGKSTVPRAPIFAFWNFSGMQVQLAMTGLVMLMMKAN